MTEDTGHKSDTSTLPLEKGDDGRVASDSGTTPRTYEQQMKSARIIMDRYDSALRKLSKL